MGKQDIIDRIIADAEDEGAAIIAEAEKTASGIREQALKDAEERKALAVAQAQAKAKAIKDGKAATARLDGAKIMLSAKRGVLDGIYDRAYKKLMEIDRHDCVALSERLLKEFAEDGDSIVFSSSFPCKEEVAALSVVKQKHLNVMFDGADVDGGFILVGKNADKDVSLSAILNDDRQRYEAEIASQIFNDQGE
jgi:vacuolar-type H+-ATPase subunit E/Vma4